MLMRIALSLALAFLPVLAAQKVIPQLDKSKPPADRPLKAPEREKIDPKDYPRYTPEKFKDGPAANWRKALKPEVIEGDLAKMKNPRTNANWNGKYTLKYESIVDANKKTVGHGVSRATWNSTGKVYSEGNWRNDQYHGVWTFYTEQGVLESTKCYKEGKLNGPYAEFKDGGLYRWGTCAGGLFSGEFRYFHKDGWLQHRALWDGSKDPEVLVWDRAYNEKGELNYHWNYVDGKVAGDQYDWVDPTYDENGKLTNSGYAGRFEIEHLDEDSKLHGWQSFYAISGGYRLYDTWYEHGEQTGPFFTNDATGKQIGGGTKTKGISTGKWWDIFASGIRADYTLNDKGEYDGDYIEKDAAGKERQRGVYKANKKVGVWIYSDASGTSSTAWSADGVSGLDGEYSFTDNAGKLQVKGMYAKGKRTGDWICRDSAYEIRKLVHYIAIDDAVFITGKGAFTDDQRTGQWTWTRADGTLAAEGGYEAGKRSGTFRYYHADGKSLAAQGEFLADSATASWVFYYADGKKAAEGEVLIGLKFGAWVHYYANGAKSSEGEFKKGDVVGAWSYYYENGKLQRRGTFVRPTDAGLSERVGEWDEFNEQGELTRKNYYADTAPETLRGYATREAPLETAPEGVVLDPLLPNGTFATYQSSAWGGAAVLISRIVVVNGQPAGKAQQYYPNGKLGAEGLLYGDKREGLWKYWYDSGVQKEEGTFVAGVLEGPTRSWRTDGTLSSAGTFEQNKRKGLWTTYHLDGKTPDRESTYGANEQYDGPLTDYYANGQVRNKGSYAAGKQEGEWQSFFESGAKREIVNYKAGKLDGRYLAWHENGQQQYDRTFLDGKDDGAYQQWHANGQLASKGSYKAGRMVGTWQYWFENGKPEAESPFDAEGNLNGTYQRWHENGKLAAKGDYAANEKVGTWQEWYENGQLELEEQYDAQGKVTSSKHWNEDGTEKK